MAVRQTADGPRDGGSGAAAVRGLAGINRLQLVPEEVVGGRRCSFSWVRWGVTPTRPSARPAPWSASRGCSARTRSSLQCWTGAVAPVNGSGSSRGEIPASRRRRSSRGPAGYRPRLSHWCGPTRHPCECSIPSAGTSAARTVANSPTRPPRSVSMSPATAGPGLGRALGFPARAADARAPSALARIQVILESDSADGCDVALLLKATLGAEPRWSVEGIYD